MIKTSKKKKDESTETKKSFEQKDNSGALFVNSNKESEKHPDLNGSVLINGVEYWVSAWEKTSKAGDQYYSLAFNKKDKE